MTLSLSGNAAPPPINNEQDKWIAEAIVEIQSLKTGMTRADLLKVFTEEGGISSRIQQTFVYRRSPYIKVDVTFQIQEANDALSGDKNTDVITSISKPYLEWPIVD